MEPTLSPQGQSDIGMHHQFKKVEEVEKKQEESDQKEPAEKRTISPSNNALKQSGASIVEKKKFSESTKDSTEIVLPPLEGDVKKTDDQAEDKKIKSSKIEEFNISISIDDKVLHQSSEVEEESEEESEGESGFVTADDNVDDKDKPSPMPQSGVDQKQQPKEPPKQPALANIQQSALAQPEQKPIAGQQPIQPQVQPPGPPQVQSLVQPPVQPVGQQQVPPPGVQPQALPNRADLLNQLNQIHIKIQNQDKDYKNIPTQGILRDIFTNVGAIADPKTFSFKSELTVASSESKNKDKVVVEPYISQSGKTFYKLSATYTFTFEINGVEYQETIKIPIYTNAENPEDALIAAANYKDAMVNLAQAPEKAGQPYQGRLGDYDQLKDAERKSLLDQSVFRLHFTYDNKNRLKALKSFETITKDSKPIALKLNEDENEKDFLYVRDVTKLRPMIRVPKEKFKAAPGQIVYDNKRDALLNSFVVNDSTEKVLDRLAREKKSPLERIKELKDEITKKQNEFKSEKAKFIQEPMIKWFSEKDTKEFEELIAGMAALKDLDAENINLQGLPDNLARRITSYHVTNNQMDEIVGKMGKYYEKDVTTLKDFFNTELAQDPNHVPTDPELINVIQRIKADYPNDTSINPSPGTQPQPTQKQIIDAMIKLKEKEAEDLIRLNENLHQIQIGIAKEQESFNESLSRLQEINRDLKKARKELKKLRAEAGEIIANHAQHKPEEIVKANEIHKQISQEKIIEVKKQTTKNEEFIVTVLRRVGLLAKDEALKEKAIGVGNQPFVE